MPLSGVRRRHGGPDVQRPMARRLLRGNNKGMAVGVVLHHRAARSQMGGGPRIPIWLPHTAHLLERDRPNMGGFGRADRTSNLRPKAGEQEPQACQRSLGHAYLPDPPMPTTSLQIVGVRSGRHQTLSGLFDTSYEDAWKVLFKGAEAPTSATEDRGFSLQRPAGEVSYFTLHRTLIFHSLTLCGI